MTNTPSLQERIERILELDKSRNQGEWFHDGFGDSGRVCYAAGGFHHLLIAEVFGYGGKDEALQKTDTNTSFIAAAPEMAQIIRELVAARDRWHIVHVGGSLSDFFNHPMRAERDTLKAENAELRSYKVQTQHVGGINKALMRENGRFREAIKNHHCHKCDDEGWLRWNELDVYTGPAIETGCDDTKYSCDHCTKLNETLTPTPPEAA